MVAFHDIGKLPTGHDVGDAAIRLDAAVRDLGNEFAITIHEHLPVFDHALSITNVQYHKIILGIGNQNLALQAGGKRWNVIGIGQILNLFFELGVICEQDFLFLENGDFVPRLQSSKRQV